MLLAFVSTRHDLLSTLNVNVEATAEMQEAHDCTCSAAPVALQHMQRASTSNPLIGMQNARVVAPFWPSHAGSEAPERAATRLSIHRQGGPGWTPHYNTTKHVDGCKSPIKPNRARRGSAACRRRWRHSRGPLNTAAAAAKPAAGAAARVGLE